eukprot:498527-Amphidinium_carterae.1
MAGLTTKRSAPVEDETPSKRRRMTIGGSSTEPTIVARSPALFVDADDEFDQFLLHSQGLENIKMEQIKDEKNV